MSKNAVKMYYIKVWLEINECNCVSLMRKVIYFYICLYLSCVVKLLIFANYYASRMLLIPQVVLSTLLIGEHLICDLNYGSPWNFLGNQCQC